MFSMRLYADDTSLTVSGKNKDVLLYQINLELPYIYDWLCANKLTLNLKKTKYLVFQPLRSSINIMTKVKRYLGKHCVVSIYYSL
ncbi:hypothetical protein P5673_029021, partial [Acropora cervicornis]